MLGDSIFPVDAVTTVTGAITSALSDNMGVILGVLGFSVALTIVLRLFTKHAKPKV